jgi:hypothetical protein
MLPLGWLFGGACHGCPRAGNVVRAGLGGEEDDGDVGLGLGADRPKTGFWKRQKKYIKSYLLLIQHFCTVADSVLGICDQVTQSNGW